MAKNKKHKKNKAQTPAIATPVLEAVAAAQDAITPGVLEITGETSLSEMADTATGREPGGKPRLLIVEDSLKCQTSEGEISLSLKIPLSSIRMLMSLADTEMDELETVDFLLDEVLPAHIVDQLENLSDGAEAFGLIMDYSEALGERMGASLGK